MHGFANLSSARLWPAAEAAVSAAVDTIPPLWPLASSVAVNPFLGQADEPLEVAAARLARLAGTPVTMPRTWYAERTASGRIEDQDLAKALSASPWEAKPGDIAGVKLALGRPAGTPLAIPTIADLAAAVSGIDWPGIIADRIGHWAAGYFDEGQALWRAGRDRGAYWSWRETATHDLTPEILGLPGFGRFVAAAPETARGALARGIATLELEDAVLTGVFARALTTLGGWAQYGRYHRFQAELASVRDDTALELLAIRLVWEEALFARYREQITQPWREACLAHAAPVTPSDDQRIDAILQYAAELGAQRNLTARLAGEAVGQPIAPTIQAAFCIDVRSEIFRRALEASDARVQTLGFAGFFGLASAHRRFASDVVEKRLPVLLNPGLSSVAGEMAEADLAQRYRARASRAWGRFKLAAVSSFAFVEAAGPVYLLKLIRDALGRGTPAP
ncbi:MAG TPA: putative inorganic carbon transporter subunit DabA, partial [Sphingomonas sp.]